jgi:hypothetical protein
VLAGLYFLTRKTASPLVALASAKVKAGELVSAESYRVIQTRRAGMSYVKAEGQPGAMITFTSDRDGVFTRNTVQEADGLYAEVK